MNNIVGIAGAMDVEVSTLCQKLQNKEVVKFGGLEFNHGFLNSKEVVIVKSGVGKVNAALCVQTLVNKFNVTQIINTGIAGATGKGLGVFDFVISSEVAYHDVDVQIFGYKIGQIPGQEQFFVADEQLVQKAVQVAESSSFAKEHKFLLVTWSISVKIYYKNLVIHFPQPHTTSQINMVYLLYLLHHERKVCYGRKYQSEPD